MAPPKPQIWGSRLLSRPPSPVSWLRTPLLMPWPGPCPLGQPWQLLLTSTVPFHPLRPAAPLLKVRLAVCQVFRPLMFRICFLNKSPDSRFPILSSMPLLLVFWLYHIASVSLGKLLNIVKPQFPKLLN
jgi:hypothetical protein